jgi:hypothetical protein
MIVEDEGLVAAHLAGIEQPFFAHEMPRPVIRQCHDNISIESGWGKDPRGIGR